MKKNTKILVGVGVTAAAFLGIGIAAASAAGPRGDGDGGGGGGGGGGGYRGPGPNRPDGRSQPGRTPTGPSTQRPEVEADDLWIAPDCSDVVVGARWFEDVARPAIEAWSADGIPRLEPDDTLSTDPGFSPERVVREIIGPYAPLCMETWPWRDVQLAQNPPPLEEEASGYEAYLEEYEEWDTALANARDAAYAERPSYGNLVADLYRAVLDVAGQIGPEA